MVKKTKKESKIRIVSKKIFGLFLIVMTILFFVAIASYHSDDLSFNNIKDGTSQNWLGYFGGSLAELSAGCGLALPLFVIGFAVFGYQLYRYGKILFFKWRLFAFVTGVLSMTPLLSILFKQNEVYYIGEYPVVGKLGKKLLDPLGTLLNKLPLDNYTDIILIFVLGIITLFSFNLVMGITFKSWYHLLKFVFQIVKNIVLKVWTVLKFFFNLIRGRKPAVQLPKFPKIRLEPKLETKAEKQPKPQKEIPHVAPKIRLSNKVGTYQFPSLDLLSRPKNAVSADISQKELDETAKNLENVLKEFGIYGEIVAIRPGPVVTLYELKPAPGTKTARVIGLSDDIARSMCAVSVRIAVVPGTDSIGIEIPNKLRETVWFKDLIADSNFTQTKNALNVALGKDIGGKNVYADLSKMPHLLIAGTTGSGKSVGVNSMILSLLYEMSPEECKMIMIDPKMLEFSMYNGIPHLLTPVITDPAKAVVGLKWAVREMEERYRKMTNLNVRNIFGYNQKLKELQESGEKPVRTIQVGFDPETGKPIYEHEPLDTTPMPYIVIVVDEIADLMLVAGKEVEAAIQRLAQMARAAGIHLIMATQRPSVDVITGVVKANFPTRISFQVTSKFDSMTILGEKGAEQLLGMGDMLYMPSGLKPLRVHGCFVKDSEVEAVANFLKTQGAPEYVDDVTEGELNPDKGNVFDKTGMGSGSDDDLYRQALEIVHNDKRASTSHIQRKLRIGYNRAASLMDRMEEEGIVSPADRTGKREIIG